MIGLSPHQTSDRSVPQLRDPLAQWAPQRVKVENFLYILHSSNPRRVQRHQCYTTCWGRSCCKKTTMPYLPTRPLLFTEGQTSAVFSVNLGPPHISKTIRAWKLKFTHLDGSSALFGSENFSAMGRRRGAVHIHCKFGTHSYLGNY